MIVTHSFVNTDLAPLKYHLDLQDKLEKIHDWTINSLKESILGFEKTQMGTASASADITAPDILSHFRYILSYFSILSSELYSIGLSLCLDSGVLALAQVVFTLQCSYKMFDIVHRFVAMIEPSLSELICECNYATIRITVSLVFYMTSGYLY